MARSHRKAAPPAGPADPQRGRDAGVGTVSREQAEEAVKICCAGPAMTPAVKASSTHPSVWSSVWRLVLRLLRGSA